MNGPTKNELLFFMGYYRSKIQEMKAGGPECELGMLYGFK